MEMEPYDDGDCIVCATYGDHSNSRVFTDKYGTDDCLECHQHLGSHTYGHPHVVYGNECSGFRHVAMLPAISPQDEFYAKQELAKLMRGQ